MLYMRTNSARRASTAVDATEVLWHVFTEGSAPGNQVWVYEEADSQSESNLYVHHDIMLPAFPLSLAWLDCNPSRAGEPGNLAAVRLLRTPRRMLCMQAV